MVVVPYDERWKRDFLKITAELLLVLEKLIIGIDHVRSTSVHDLSAKPIMDINIVIKEGTFLQPVIRALEKIGYQHEGNLGILGREAFKYSGKDHLNQHHLYVCPLDSLELKKHIAVRDYLRDHPDAVCDYSSIKEQGAKLHSEDIDGYIAYKNPLSRYFMQK